MKRRSKLTTAASSDAKRTAASSDAKLDVVVTRLETLFEKHYDMFQAEYKALSYRDERAGDWLAVAEKGRCEAALSSSKRPQDKYIPVWRSCGRKKGWLPPGNGGHTLHRLFAEKRGFDLYKELVELKLRPMLKESEFFNEEEKPRCISVK